MPKGPQGPPGTDGDEDCQRFPRGGVGAVANRGREVVDVFGALIYMYVTFELPCLLEPIFLYVWLVFAPECFTFVEPSPRAFFQCCVC